MFAAFPGWIIAGGVKLLRMNQPSQALDDDFFRFVLLEP